MPPALLLAGALVLVSAFGFHAVAGRTLRGLGWMVVAALAGFLGGEAGARALWGERLAVGQVHLAHGLAGAWLAMAIARRRVA